MSARRLVILLMLLATGLASAADLTSEIESVTVYPDGAVITRVATANLVSGENEIRLINLVDSIEPEYLQVEVTASNVRIGQIRLGTEQQRDAFNAELASLNTQIEALNMEIRAVDDSSSAANLRLKFLDGLAQGYANEAWIENSRGSASTDSLRGALELLQSGAEDASALIRGNLVRKTQLQKDLSVLQRTLAELRGGSLQSATASFSASADSATTTEIRIRYFQEDAAWRPVYEARLDSNSGSLELIQQANVEQQTNEEWRNVALTLSTSQPSGELIAPAVDSEFLNIIEPPPPRPQVARSTANSAMMADSLEEIVVTGSQISRTASVGNFAVNYEMPGLSTIPNDSDEATLLDLDRYSFATDLVTRVVPRESTEAFLAARFVYDQPVPLYSSDMLVFVDGVFAGYSEMPTALPQAEVLLPMGQDRRVEVKAETQGGEDSRGGIINRRKNEVTDYVFEITNRRSQPSYVEVLDRIPVARNRDIDVEVPRSATAPDESDLNDQPGLIMWKKTLEAGEAWRIRHQYTVSYPERYLLIRQ